MSKLSRERKAKQKAQLNENVRLQVEPMIRALYGHQLLNRHVAEILAHMDPDAPFSVTNSFEGIDADATGQNLSVNKDGGLCVDFHPQN